MKRAKRTTSFKSLDDVTLKQVYSTYVKESLRADTIRVNGIWGCDFYKDNHLLKTEVYTGHSEAYAEDAAENYVEGIKKVWTIYLKH